MAAERDVSETQFENSLKVPKSFLLVSGIKIFRTLWNSYLENFVDGQLFYYDCIILHTVIYGEIYYVIDCIQTGKSIVELSFNLPCITISALATVKAIFAYLNRNVLFDLYYKLKEIHCENDENNFIAVKRNPEGRKIVSDAIKMLNTFVILICVIMVIVILNFCIVPGLLMAYKYHTTGELVIIYPYMVKYHFSEVYSTSFWPLIYFHQVMATFVSCSNVFGCETLLFSLCSYIDMHFRLLSIQFENIVSDSKEKTKMCLSKAVRRHQELIHLVNQTEMIYSKSSVFHIVTSSFLICLSAFIITIADEINVKCAYFTFLTLSLSQISLVCYFPDMLMRSSTEISQSVYKSMWYEADEDAKRIMLLVMIRSQKPCKLTAWRFVDLNLRAFTRILSTSWSYFALLKTMYK